MAGEKREEKIIYNEISAATGGVMGTPELLADEQLAEFNEGLSPYKLLLKDTQVAACYEQRFNALIACDWQVTAGGQDKQSQKAADFLREQISGLDWDDINEKMAYGRHYGYSAAELMYIRDGAYIGLSDIFVRQRSRFEINHKKELVLLDGMNKKPMPSNKFWTYICGGHDHDSPMGLGLAYNLYWPVWFKKHGAKFWAIYTEKFAAPTGKSKYRNGATDEEKATALKAAKALQVATGIAVPEGIELELVEASRRSGGDYNIFLEYWDGSIAKTIMGQKGTTEIGQYVGTAQAHGKVAQNIIKADADLLCGSFNKKVIPFLTQLNFPNAALPKIERNLETPEEREIRIKEDKEIYAMGWKRTDESFAKSYGDGFERINMQTGGTERSEVTGAGVAQKAIFAENKATRPPITYTDAGEITNKLAADTSPYISDMLQKVKDIVFDEKITSLEDLADELGKIHPDLDDESFNQLISEAMEYSYLQGVDDAK